MPPYLPIRAISRSQNVRIGGKKVGTDTTTYVDLGANTAPYTPRKELRSHLAFGAVVVVGALTASNSAVAVIQGVFTSATKAEEPEVTTTAGEIRNRDTGESVQVAELKAGKKKVAAAGKERKDSIIVKNDTGALKYEAGTAAVAGKAVINAVPGGSTLVAEVVFTETAETATVTNKNRA